MEYQNKKNRILIADDDKISIKIYNKIFGEEYEVLFASDGNEAIEVLENHQEISLAILDIYMPGKNGFEVLEQMKKDIRWEKIPVLICTTEGEESNIVRALTLGASDCIAKPIHAEIMQNRVKNTIEKEYLKRVRLESFLETTNSKLHLLMDNIPGGTMELKLEDTVQLLYFNDEICHLTGLTTSEFKKRYAKDFLKVVYQTDKERVQQAFASCRQGLQRIDINFRIYHRDNYPVWLHFVMAKFGKKTSECIYHAVLFDISREKDSEFNAEQSAQKFRYLAEHDALTGINNRNSFCEKTEKMLRCNPDTEYVLLCYDIEHFKVVNDLFGHEIGNRVLKTLAMHFASMMLGIGTYGRLADDRFVICYPIELFTPEEELERVSAVLDTVNINYKMKICMGVYFIKDEVLSVNGMCDRATLALEGAKGNYLKNYAYYDSTLIEKLLYEQELCEEMEDALVKEEFEVYIQPKYNLNTKKIIGGESLIRWRHSKRGLISPADFIPLFEKNGAIVRLDAYVWRKTCQYIAEWKKRNIPIVPVSVNISRIDFVNMNIGKYLEELMKKYNLDTSALELEVTESVYANDRSLFYGELEKLQDLGFKILMDDFGSGYSSFNMLKEAPVDVLKLDLKFLSGSNQKYRADKILAAIMYMARLIGISVIAEGVETKEHVELLKDIHCDMAQGYYFSRPIPAEEFINLLIQQENGEDMVGWVCDEKQYRNYVRRKRRYQDQKGMVLLVDEAGINREILYTLFKNVYTVLLAANTQEVENIIKEHNKTIDLILIDVQFIKENMIDRWMKGMDGANIPVVAITQLDDVSQVIYALQSGAVDYIGKPFVPEIVTSRVHHLLDSSSKMKQIAKERKNYQYRAALDQMTQLYNKVTMEQLTNDLLLTRPAQMHALLIFDVDNFKQINDTDGHLVGDETIRRVSSFIMTNFRHEDLIGRIGGDEFAVLMKGIKSRTQACEKAEHIIHGMENGMMGDTDRKVTISIGIAFYEGKEKTYEELMEKADHALYQAKLTGKSKWVCYNTEKEVNDYENKTEDADRR